MPTTGSRTSRTPGSTTPIASATRIGYKGYGPNCWGLTAGDSVKGYDAHSPSSDKGVITPSAALASFPYAPDGGDGGAAAFP